MKQFIRKVLEQYIQEGGGIRKSTDPPDERYQRVADEVIKFMDHYNTNFIPNYKMLQDWRPEPGDTYDTKIRQILEKNLFKDEYNLYVKPLIKKLRPDVTYTTDSKSGFQVDTDVIVYSIGEKIVYNTFKMNGIKLIYNDPKFQFTYFYNGKKKIKRPDFYWAQNDTLIEVAGLEEKTYGKNYTSRLQKAVQRLKRMGKKIVVLDYNKYLKNTKGFYEYVCKKFGFPYDPKDFWLANQASNVDIEQLKRETEELIKKGTQKNAGERWIQNRNITKLLTKAKDDIVGKPEGFKSAWEYKRETGIGLKWSDPEVRKKAQIAWCQTKNHSKDISQKFKEVFPGETLGNEVVRTMKLKFPEEFNVDNKETICQELGIPYQPQEVDLTTRRWANPELKNKVQQIWCNSNGTVGEIYRIFRETYPNEKISEGTINLIKTNFPNEFDINNKTEICESEQKINESVYLKRRVSMDELDSSMKDALDYSTVMYKRKHGRNVVPFEKFLNSVLSMVMDEIHPKLIDKSEEFPYNEIFEYIYDLFRGQIARRYIKEFT